MPHTYILFSEKLNKYYVGSTSDIHRRIEDHNRGKEKFTSTGMPWQIVYSETFGNLADARRREFQIKKQKTRSCIERLIASAA